MPPVKRFSTYFPATAADGDDLYRLERLVELRKSKQSSINKSDIIRNAFAFYYAAQPEVDAIEAELMSASKINEYNKNKNTTIKTADSAVLEKIEKLMAAKVKAADPA